MKKPANKLPTAPVKLVLPSDEEFFARILGRRLEVMSGAEEALARLSAILKSGKIAGKPITAKGYADLTKAILQAQEAHRIESGENHKDRKEVAAAGKADQSTRIDFRAIYASLTQPQKQEILKANGRLQKPMSFEVEPD